MIHKYFPFHLSAGVLGEGQARSYILASRIFYSIESECDRNLSAMKSSGLQKKNIRVLELLSNLLNLLIGSSRQTHEIHGNND